MIQANDLVEWVCVREQTNSGTSWYHLVCLVPSGTNWYQLAPMYHGTWALWHNGSMTSGYHGTWHLAMTSSDGRAGASDQAFFAKDALYLKRFDVNLEPTQTASIDGS